jgi:hypothetical protein
MTPSTAGTTANTDPIRQAKVNPSIETKKSYLKKEDCNKLRKI